MFIRDATIEAKNGKYGNALACLLMDILPNKVLNTLTCFNLGRLTGHGSLSTKEVPTITVNDIMDAMRTEDK